MLYIAAYIYILLSKIRREISTLKMLFSLDPISILDLYFYLFILIGFVFLWNSFCNIILHATCSDLEVRESYRISIECSCQFRITERNFALLVSASARFNCGITSFLHSFRLHGILWLYLTGTSTRQSCYPMLHTSSHGKCTERSFQ